MIPYPNRCRFKGVHRHGSGFNVVALYQGQRIWFPIVSTDVEAALCFNFVSYLLGGGYGYLNKIRESEMPSEERKNQLWDMTTNKLIQYGLLVESKG